MWCRVVGGRIWYGVVGGCVSGQSVHHYVARLPDSERTINRLMCCGLVRCECSDDVLWVTCAEDLCPTRNSRPTACRKTLSTCAVELVDLLC